MFLRVATLPLVGIGWVIYWFGGDATRIGHFLDTLEDLCDDCYPQWTAIPTMLIGTALGFGLAQTLGTDPGPHGTPSLYRTIAMAVCCGVAALVLSAIAAVGTFMEYSEYSGYQPQDGMVGLWQIGYTFGILCTSVGLGYFVLS